MGFNSVVLALTLVVCLSITAFAQGPKNEIVEPTFSGEEMSGSEIYDEVQEGVYGDSNLSFRNESLFTIRKDTGMTPGITDKGVRTPVRIIKGLGHRSCGRKLVFYIGGHGNPISQARPLPDGRRCVWLR